MRYKTPKLYQQCFWLIVHSIAWLLLGGIGCVVVVILIVAWNGEGSGLSWLQTLVQNDYHTLVNTAQPDEAVRLYHWLQQIPTTWMMPPVTLPMISEYTQQQCWLRFLPFISGALLGSKLLLIRIFVLLHGTLLFLLLGCVGVVDGFTQRAIRRMGAGRESALIYHHAKRCIHVSLMLGFFVDLIAPLPLSQAVWIVVTAAVLFGVAIQLAAKTFKKYL